ncbi:MAG: YchJ family protein [Pseudomonadota bacterium]
MEMCPCKSGKKYTSCCFPLISGNKLAITAEQLMRSRYTAFSLNNSSYLLDTWHKDFRPQKLDLAPSLKWIKLEIVKSQTAMVHFRAYSLSEHQVHILEEKSNFIKIDKQWFYSTGEVLPAQQYKISRNSSCPCGSGKKFKRCCG